jgi:hypothetical protein
MAVADSELIQVLSLGRQVALWTDREFATTVQRVKVIPVAIMKLTRPFRGINFFGTVGGFARFGFGPFEVDRFTAN